MLAGVTTTNLDEAISAAIADSIKSGELNIAMPKEIDVERPRNRAHGDYATNIALQLAREAGLPPRKIAEVLSRRLRAVDGIAKVEVAGPGFINFTLEYSAQGALVATIAAAGESYGSTEIQPGELVNLEFVSANPTGPLHIGGARWAAVGDALARIMTASGVPVTKEYYFNDAGAQIDRFARSLMATANGKPVPKDGYRGDYVADITTAITTRRPDITGLAEEEQLTAFRTEGVSLMFNEIKASLARFNVEFDVYRNEQALHDAGLLSVAVDRLKQGGHTYEDNGALWLRTTDFGDDKDRVLVKTDGSWTYFAADCAYYLDKRERGFSKELMILGADHHGYVGRLRAMAACFGDDPEQTIEVLIGQLVNLVRDGEPVRLSKRAGDVVTIDDLIAAVGTDAARYALARASIDSAIDLDIAQLTARNATNPVFYVQYAHARLSTLQRRAVESGVDRGSLQDFQPGLLNAEQETELLGVLSEFPRVVTTAGQLREVHRVARYLETLAGSYHRWYDSCRVLPQHDEPATDLNRARLWLAEATRIVLRNGLSLLGVSAPATM